MLKLITNILAVVSSVGLLLGMAPMFIGICLFMVIFTMFSWPFFLWGVFLYHFGIEVYPKEKVKKDRTTEEMLEEMLENDSSK